MTKVWLIFAFVHLCLLSPTVCEAAQGMFDFSVKVCSYISLCVSVCLSVRLLTRLCDTVHAIHVKRQVIAKKYSYSVAVLRMPQEFCTGIYGFLFWL